MYNLEIQKIADEIKKRGSRRVLLQLPDGLRPVAISITEALKRLTDAEIIVSGDSCYGACDLALSQAEIIGADLIVHYAHSKLLKTTPIPVDKTLIITTQKLISLKNKLKNLPKKIYKKYPGGLGRN